MKYIDADLLKAEIELLKKHHRVREEYAYGWKNALNAISKFLDTLPEQPVIKKSNALFDECVKNCDPAIMKEVSDNIDKMLGRQPVEGLEEAAMAQYPKVWKEYPKDGIIRSEEYYDLNEARRDAFIAGAEWGAEHLKR